MLDTHYVSNNPFKIYLNDDLQGLSTSLNHNRIPDNSLIFNEKNSENDKTDLSLFQNHKRKKAETFNPILCDENNSYDDKGCIGRWTEQEHLLFVDAVKKYGKNWKIIEKIVRTRTPTQLRSHAQKFFSKIRLTYNTDDPIDYIKTNIVSLDLEEKTNQDQGERKKTEIEEASNIKSERSNKESIDDLKVQSLNTMNERVDEERYKNYLFNYIGRQLIQSSPTYPSLAIFSILLKSKIFTSQQLKKQNISTNLRNFLFNINSVLQLKLELMRKDIEPSLNVLHSEHSIKKESILSFMDSSFQINDVYKVFKLKHYFP